MSVVLIVLVDLFNLVAGIIIIWSFIYGMSLLNFEEIYRRPELRNSICRMLKLLQREGLGLYLFLQKFIFFGNFAILSS